MKTSRIISNISYNTDYFFSEKVTDLVNRKIIDWCYWIRHKPDIDEKKEHIHFVLKPSSAIDTFRLREEFMEFDKYNPSIPLTCTMRFFFTSSMDDWLLYVVHDPGYLASKGQQRNISYNPDEIHATDPEALYYEWNSIDRIKYQRLNWLKEAAENKDPFALLVQDGIIPIAQRAQYEAQYRQLLELFENPEISGRNISHEEE